MKSPSFLRLERLQSLRERLPISDRTMADASFIGALSAETTDEQWDTALATAERIANDWLLRHQKEGAA